MNNISVIDTQPTLSPKNYSEFASTNNDNFDNVAVDQGKFI